MLHLSTINPPTLELLNSLMSLEEFQNLRLVGGTALALQIGHRMSIDLDFFGEIQFENLNQPLLFKGFREVISLSKSRNINVFSIDGIKVDFVNYSYPWLKNQLSIDGVRLAQKEDIAAMKLAAITGRGSRKDFVDIFYLLKEFNFSELLGFYNKKYSDGSEYMLLKSLTYFDDAEEDAEVTDFHKTPWGEIKATILQTASQYTKRLK